MQIEGKRREGRPYKLRAGIFPIELIIDYAERGLTHTEIAKLTGLSRPSISQRLQTAQYTPERIRSYRDNLSQILLYYQALILNSLTPQAIEKMSSRDKIFAFAILYDKYRLETGQSTSNQAITSLIQAVHAKPKPEPEPDVLEVTETAPSITADNEPSIDNLE